MTQKIRLFRSHDLWSKFLDSNPQFFRELKGKLKTRNVIVAAALSVLVQFLTVVYFLGKLPEPNDKTLYYGRYGVATYNHTIYHSKDEFGHWLVNWQLWWLDLFIALSIIGIFALLVVGTYMLIADMVKEDARGTLNFIRLTPQSASSILLGKILGVPILLYGAIALLLPLHLSAGLQSQIPLSFILAFDAIVVGCCAFIYCLALLWSLLNIGVSGIKSWLASSTVVFLLCLSTAILVDSGNMKLDRFAASLLIFNPAIVLSYLIDAAQFDFGKSFDFLSVSNLATLSFYGQILWTKATIGMGLILLNFGLWTYWCWSVLKRRFHNPQGTILSKKHSYWLTTCFIFITLGFALQTSFYNGHTFKTQIEHQTDLIIDNFFFLQVCLSLFGLGLIFALSPHRQTLHDWARYRHQLDTKSSLLKELVFGENSPAIVAVALNLAIAFAFITPSIFIVLSQSEHYIAWGFLLCITNILLCAVVAQFILMAKTNKRGVWSIVTVASIIILPPVCLGIAGVTIKTMPLAWLFSFAPIKAAEHASVSAIAWAILGQWLAISVIGLQMTRKLKHAGASETKALMSRAIDRG